MAVVRASSTLPYSYRLTLTTIEPFCAIAGAILTMLSPTMYIRSLTRNVGTHDPATSFLFTQLAGAWVMFAFEEAVLLRLVDELRVWKLVCMGMLLSDAFYCWSCVMAVGGWSEWSALSSWTVEDWFVSGSSLLFMAVRMAVVLEIGFRNKSLKETKS